MATTRSKIWEKLKRKWGKNKTRGEIESGSPWKETETLTQENPKGTDITIPLTDPYTVNPIVKRAQRKRYQQYCAK
jgi:hypothetical protein